MLVTESNVDSNFIVFTLLKTSKEILRQMYSFPYLIFEKNDETPHFIGECTLLLGEYTCLDESILSLYKAIATKYGGEGIANGVASSSLHHRKMSSL